MSDSSEWAAGCAAALASLPGIGPAGLLDLLRDHSPDEAWRRVRAGEVRRPEARATSGEGRLPAGAGYGPGPRPAGSGGRPSWRDAAAATHPSELGRRLRAAAIGITYLGQPDYPAALRDDPEPPAVLFWLGDLVALNRPCVAVVGTRRCSGYGRTVATEIGRDLAEAGVCVVSGLALGIDGAAHTGALSIGGAGAGPVGVAASGVDRPYPSRHAPLWAAVATAGAMLSETAPGRPAEPWRFPARNRIIAGLCRAVVVVESHAGGGSMLTVAAAAHRGVDVLAVPGPVTSPSSVGTNQLLFDGVAPARHAGDILAAIGDLRPWPSPKPGAGDPRAAEAGLDASSRRVLDSVEWTPTSTSTMVERTGLSLGPLSTILLHLEMLGLVRGGPGWWERAGR